MIRLIFKVILVKKKMDINIQIILRQQTISYRITCKRSENNAGNKPSFVNKVDQDVEFECLLVDVIAVMFDCC
jgi:hypothetical protein